MQFLGSVASIRGKEGNLVANMLFLGCVAGKDWSLSPTNIPATRSYKES